MAEQWTGGAEFRLPFSDEAEQSVLGAVILDADCVPAVMEFVERKFFYREQHRKIFDVIARKFLLHESIDIVTLLDGCVQDRVFPSADDTKLYLTRLAQMVPSARNVEAYAGILRDKFYLRSLVQASREIGDAAAGADASAAKVLEMAEQKIFEIRGGGGASDLQHVRDAVFSALDHLQKLSSADREQYLGIATGFGDLDRIITGLNRSDLIVLAARPGMGKTAFALNIAANVALRKGRTVAVFSLEMSREQLMYRLFASEGGVNTKGLQTGDLPSEQWDKVMRTAPAIARMPLYIDDSSAPTVTSMKAKLRRLRNLDFVVIDYLQLMKSERRTENRVTEVSELTRNLKSMAKDLNVPVLLLSQLSRGPESRADRRPLLSDLRESGSIEQDADIVMFLYREAYYDKDAEDRTSAQCIVAKNRHGEIGSVDLRWDGDHTRFYAVSKQPHDE